MKQQLVLPGSEHREAESAETRRWLTVRDVMGVLGIGRDKVYDLIRSGDLFSVKVGRYRRFPPGSLEDYLQRLREDAA
jgi:excisionase family DNA binding protein